MSNTTRRYASYELEEVLIEHLVGHTVVHAGYDTLVLDNGVKLIIEQGNSDCCSYVDLDRTFTVPNIITDVRLHDDEDRDDREHWYDSDYKAWITVLTEAGEVNLAEAHGNFSNGYYLHGFALGVTVVLPDDN